MSGPFIYQAPTPPPEHKRRSDAPNHGHPSLFIPPQPFPALSSPLPSYNLSSPDLPQVTHAHITNLSQARPRSWHMAEGGALGLLPAGFVSTMPPGQSQTQLAPSVSLAPPAAQGFQRRHSVGQASAANPPPRMNPDSSYPWLYAPSPAPTVSTPSPPPAQSVHDLLQPGSDICWDLSSATMDAHICQYDGQEDPITSSSLRDPALTPALTEMSIIVGGHWTVDVRSMPLTPMPVHGVLPYHNQDVVPPLSLQDVLYTLHRALQGPITHIDWARLSTTEQHAVERAYRRRCRTAARVNAAEGERLASQGIKKVDFLLDQFMFRGLLPLEGSHNQSTMRLVSSA
jgi:hypothetical protein